MDAQSLGDVTRMKLPRKVGWQQRKQVGGGLKLVNADDGDQPLIFDDVIVLPPAPPAAMPRIAALFDFNERRLQRQPWMRKNAREIDQLVKQVEHRPLLRT